MYESVECAEDEGSQSLSPSGSLSAKERLSSLLKATRDAARTNAPPSAVDSHNASKPTVPAEGTETPGRRRRSAADLIRSQAAELRKARLVRAWHSGEASSGDTASEAVADKDEERNASTDGPSIVKKVSCCSTVTQTDQVLATSKLSSTDTKDVSAGTTCGVLSNMSIAAVVQVADMVVKSDPSVPENSNVSFNEVVASVENSEQGGTKDVAVGTTPPVSDVGIAAVVEVSDVAVGNEIQVMVSSATECLHPGVVDASCNAAPKTQCIATHTEVLVAEQGTQTLDLSEAVDEDMRDKRTWDGDWLRLCMTAKVAVFQHLKSILDWASLARVNRSWATAFQMFSHTIDEATIPLGLMKYGVTSVRDFALSCYNINNVYFSHTISYSAMVLVVVGSCFRNLKSLDLGDIQVNPDPKSFPTMCSLIPNLITFRWGKPKRACVIQSETYWALLPLQRSCPKLQELRFPAAPVPPMRDSDAPGNCWFPNLKVVEYYSSISTEEFADMVESISTIDSITSHGHRLRSSDIESLVRRGKMLKSLGMASFPLTAPVNDASFSSLASVFQDIHTLEINGGGLISAKALKEVLDCSHNITSLTLDDLRGIDGDMLEFIGMKYGEKLNKVRLLDSEPPLPNGKKMWRSKCGWSPADLTNFINYCASLKCLHIDSCFDDDAANALAAHSPGVLSVTLGSNTHLSGSGLYGMARMLPCIRELNIAHVRGIGSSGIIQYCKERVRQGSNDELCMFAIGGNDVDNSSLESILLSFKHLSTLQIFACEHGTAIMDWPGVIRTFESARPIRLEKLYWEDDLEDDEKLVNQLCSVLPWVTISW